MTARDSWAQVAHDLRALAESIDAAIEPAPAAVPEAGGASAAPPQRSPAPAAIPPVPAGTNPPPVCPEHGPDKRRPGKKGGWYCSYNKGTRDNPDWCSWRVSA